ncbi:MAG: HIT domain-containing protein [Chloroflexi bacterium]|nr:HIT domain-containing protein [Chloroflexota bacterium]MCC6896512.1 HIT domain-containing protein [Anaerolineae bacterium]
MDHLYTPWRMAYIRGEKKPVDGCIFCQLATANHDNQLVIAYADHVYVTLNKYPYNNGHLMIIPYEHVESLEMLPTEVLTDLMLTTNKALAVLRKNYNPPAFNLGANLGAAAGAGIAEHFHFHIVPRWPGDANFMAVVGNTRVIPDTLENVFTELKAGWHTLFPQEKTP